MGKVIIFNLPGAVGHFNPTQGLVSELVRRGEEVIYYTDKESHDRLRSLGATPRTYEPYFEYYHSPELASDLLTPALKQLELAELSVDGLYKDLLKDRPDYIIYDSCSLWGKYLAKQLKIPGICLITTLVSTPLGVFSDRHLGGLVARTLVIGAPIVLSARRRIKALLGKMGLKYNGLIHHIFDIFQNEGDMNLVFLGRSFQPFSSTIKPHFKFVGPSLLEGRDQGDLSEYGLSDKPLIYISLGTVHNMKDDFYRTCMRAFADMPYQFIMSVGQKTDIARLGPAPKNFVIRNRVPQLEVLKRAAAFVSHGGMNSINESYYYDVPMVMVPQQPEQFFNARRIKGMNAGICLAPEQVSEKSLNDAVTQLLTDKKIQENTKRFGKELRDAGGYKAATAEIMTFIYGENTPQAVR